MCVETILPVLASVLCSKVSHLMGEVIHGDYRRQPERAPFRHDYEAWKVLWSSYVDRNFFEIAYSLERQFGQQGIYQDLPLYSFADNHDVKSRPSQGR